ncbi:MAG: hypothetical protein BM560_00680 [Roseobacter sp. MedPE-SWde]|nr:MAG: hypothetical protein BM560_00680 [Roseobacter sp. MedPE-SWde]
MVYPKPELVGSKQREMRLEADRGTSQERREKIAGPPARPRAALAEPRGREGKLAGYRRDSNLTDVLFLPGDSVDLTIFTWIWPVGSGWHTRRIVVWFALPVLGL